MRLLTELSHTYQRTNGTIVKTMIDEVTSSEFQTKIQCALTDVTRLGKPVVDTKSDNYYLKVMGKYYELGSISRFFVGRGIYYNLIELLTNSSHTYAGSPVKLDLCICGREQALDSTAKNLNTVDFGTTNEDLVQVTDLRFVKDVFLHRYKETAGVDLLEGDIVTSLPKARYKFRHGYCYIGQHGEFDLYICVRKFYTVTDKHITEYWRDGKHTNPVLETCKERADKWHL